MKENISIIFAGTALFFTIIIFAQNCTENRVVTNKSVEELSDDVGQLKVTVAVAVPKDIHCALFSQTEELWLEYLDLYCRVLKGDFDQDSGVCYCDGDVKYYERDPRSAAYCSE